MYKKQNLYEAKKDANGNRVRVDSYTKNQNIQPIGGSGASGKKQNAIVDLANPRWSVREEGKVLLNNIYSELENNALANVSLTIFGDPFFIFGRTWEGGKGASQSGDKNTYFVTLYGLQFNLMLKAN